MSVMILIKAILITLAIIGCIVLFVLSINQLAKHILHDSYFIATICVSTAVSIFVSVLSGLLYGWQGAITAALICGAVSCLLSLIASGIE